MKKRSALLSCLIVFIAFPLNEHLQAQNDLNVGYIGSEEIQLVGSNCQFSDKKGVVLQTDWVDTAWIRLDQKLIELKSKEPYLGKGPQTFSNGDVSVKTELKTIKVGKEDTVAVSGEIEISQGKVTKRFKVSGGCAA